MEDFLSQSELYDAKVVETQQSPRNAAWAELQVLNQTIESHGGIPGYAKLLESRDPEGYADMFAYKGNCGCVDERVRTDISLLGSGILFDDDQELGRFFEQSGTKTISWHPGCAAAAIAYRNANSLPADAQVNQTEVDTFAEQFARSAAEKFNLRFVGAIKPGDDAWIGSPDKHYTDTVYLTNGSFDPYSCEGMPIGFKVNIDEPNSLAKAEVLSNVAMGPHGFGELCKQFNIVVVANSEEELQATIGEAKAHFTNDVYNVTGFVGPIIGPNHP